MEIEISACLMDVSGIEMGIYIFSNSIKSIKHAAVSLEDFRQLSSGIECERQLIILLFALDSKIVLAGLDINVYISRI